MLGTSLLAMVAPSCVGLTQHARLGNVDWRMAAGLAAGTAVGSAAGSKVAVNAPAGNTDCYVWYTIDAVLTVGADSGRKIASQTCGPVPLVHCYPKSLC